MMVLLSQPIIAAKTVTNVKHFDLFPAVHYTVYHPVHHLNQKGIVITTTYFQFTCCHRNYYELQISIVTSHHKIKHTNSF